MVTDKYQAMVNIKEEPGIMGLNPTEESLDFGDLSRGMKVSRYITLKNDGGNKISIKVSISGEIADLIEVDKTDFILSPGDETKMNFDLTVPPSAEIKKYTGTVYIFKLISF